MTARAWGSSVNGPPVRGSQRVSVGRVGSMYTTTNAATDRINLHHATCRSISMSGVCLIEVPSPGGCVGHRRAWGEKPERRSRPRPEAGLGGPVRSVQREEVPHRDAAEPRRQIVAGGRLVVAVPALDDVVVDAAAAERLQARAWVPEAAAAASLVQLRQEARPLRRRRRGPAG